MKTLQTLLLASLATVAVPPTATADLRDIERAFEDRMEEARKQVLLELHDAVAAYLEENPGAPDVEKSEARLIHLCERTGRDAEGIERAGAFLESRPDSEHRTAVLWNLYLCEDRTEGKETDALGTLRTLYDANKGEAERLRFVVLEIVPAMTRGILDTEGKEAAKAFLETARADLGNNQGVGDYLGSLSGAIDQIGGRLEGLAFTAFGGEAVDIEDFRGKVVLVDFWATWCGPCIAELPNVIEAYEKYHEQGFEIIGISLDNDRAALETFLGEHEMPWVQHFDGKGWQNEIAAANGIRSIPAVFLLGPDGTILRSGPFVRGDSLHTAIEEALDLHPSETPTSPTEDGAVPPGNGGE